MTSRNRHHALGALLLAAMLATPAGAQTDARTVAPANPGSWVDAVRAIPTPSLPAGIPLPCTPACMPAGAGAGAGAGAAPAEGWAINPGAGARGERLLYNVGTPQLVPLPSSLPKDRTAPAVLLVPGGGFQFVSMDNEGFNLADKLDRLGVRVFIVKYRTLPMPAGFADFKAAITATFRDGATPDLNQRLPAAADTAAAIRLVRARAAEWRVDPARIVVVGFSAGAIAALTQLYIAGDARPDHLGLIYGPTGGVPVPTNPPPLFAALAADDRFFKSQDLGLIHGWRQAGAAVELHLYSGGGHGFASHPNGSTSDAWFDQFALWLRASGVTGAPAAKAP